MTLTQPVSRASTAPAQAAVAGAGTGRWRDGLAYGLLGAPLAFAALPLYVQLPHHYAAQLGAPLAGLGAVLLATRAADALVDPWLGRRIDGILRQGRGRALRWAVLAALLLAAGLAALFLPPAAVVAAGTEALLAWCALALVVTCLGYSSLGIGHQAWGARLGGGDAAQAGVVGWREGLSLAGVLAASVLPALAGVDAMVTACALGLVLALLALRRAPFAAAADTTEGGDTPADDAPARPWQVPAFRRLLAVFLLNGVASAVPATLVLFFVRDRLQVPQWEPLFLGAYFAAGALAMPVWVRLVPRLGLVRTWLAGMVLAVAAFAWTLALGAGDQVAFLVVCLASGAALGADLVVPGALLAKVVQHAGHGGRHEALYFGWWNCATKLNLALAAGLALPLLQLLGYAPGLQEPAALQGLALAYAGLPCLLKLLAAALLWHHRRSLETP